MLSKEQLIHELNVLDRVESYFRLYPVLTAVNLLNKDLEIVKDKIQKLKKREYNERYTHG